MEFHAELRNWRLEWMGTFMRLVGEIHNDSKGRFNDGDVICTSALTGFDGTIAVTRNTRYLLALPEIGKHRTTILWSEDVGPGDKAETYAFNTEDELAAFELGVSEAGGWMNYSYHEEGFVVPSGDAYEEFLDSREKCV